MRTYSLLPVCLAPFAMVVSTLASEPRPSTGALVPRDLRTEYRIAPTGIDVRVPRLSWIAEPAALPHRGLRQTAYHVRVASNVALLHQGSADWWDSGEVASGASTHIEYEGRPLTSRALCFWSVRVRDEAGAWSDWSAPARWTMGLLEPDDWTGRWIGAAGGRELHPDRRNDQTTQEDALPIYDALPDPWLRRVFDLPERPVRATAHVASVGFHELWVNGTKVGDDVLGPSVTDHTRRARWVAYEIADYLRPGENVVGLWLGTGWSIFPAFVTDDKPAAPIVLGQFDIDLPDGSTRRFGTDASWKSHRSSTTLLGRWNFHHFGGELVQPALHLDAWAAPGLEETGWEPAAEFSPRLTLSAEIAEPNRALDALACVAVEETEPGVWRLDLGRNFAGIFEMDLRAAPGTRITMQFSDRAEAVMTYRIHSIYEMGPTGTGTFRNRFNYSVGRWVTVRGLAERPRPEDARAWVVRPDFARASAFESSNPLFDRIWDTALWTYENLSLGGIIADCAHRERMGYGGDAHATTTLGLVNHRTEAFYTKWAQDWRDVQGREPTWLIDESSGATNSAGAGVSPGNLPYTAPTYWGGGGPAWSGICVHLPWEVYRFTGDRRILETNFAMIRAWLAFLETKAQDDILRRWGGNWDFLGDWLWPDPPRGVNGDLPETLFFNNAYWIYNLATAARIARTIGEDDFAADWEDRAAEVRRAVHARFFDPVDSSYGGGLQACLAAALLADVPPPELRSAVVRRLEREVLEVRDGHVHAGITGGALLFKTLGELRRDDLLHVMVGKRSYPGWGYMLDKGATTFWEAWDDLRAGHTHMHSSYLFVGPWFIQSVLGIQPHSEAPGFERIVVRPGVLDQTDLEWARGHFDSVRGRVAVSWSRHSERFEIDVVVPPGLSADVHLPANDAASVREGDRPLREVSEVSVLGVEDERLVVQVPSGHYRFSIERRN
jgi:alpha-L-rhamnosidase